MTGIRKSSYGKHTFDLVLKPEDVEYEKLKAFDTRIIELASSPFRTYIPSLKILRGSAMFRVTFPVNEVGIWDKNDQRINTNEFLAKQMSRNAKIAVIVRCTEMWIGGDKYGTVWKAMQMRVYPNESTSLKRWIGVKRPASPARSKEDEDGSSDAL